MKRRIKCLLWVMALSLLVSFAAAEGLELSEPLSGERVYPQGASEANASYILHYEYPRFAVTTAEDQAINDYYEKCYEEKASTIAEDESALMAEPGAPTNYERIRYQITANTDAYLSIALTTQQFLGYVESETLEGNVFARQGIYAGQLLSLSQVMGLEEDAGETDLQEASYASQLVWKLVWKIIQEQKASLQVDYFDDLTPDDLMRTLAPETDFYIDMDGNLVFYVQSGILAGDVEGILTYPFAMGELLAGVLE